MSRFVCVKGCLDIGDIIGCYLMEASSLSNRDRNQKQSALVLFQSFGIETTKFWKMLRFFNYVVWTGLYGEEFDYPRRTGNLSENKFTARVIKGLLNPNYSSASFIVDRYRNGFTYPPSYNWLFSFKAIILFYHIDHRNCNIHAWNWSNTMSI